MSDTVLLAAWKKYLAANRKLQQFGQGDDDSTFNGATACTHTCLQILIKAHTGTRYSIDQISRIAGYPMNIQYNPSRRGLTLAETQRVVSHFGLPYRLKTNATWSDVIDGMKRGPVMGGILYGYWPEDRGYVYNGRTADGRPGGFAIKNGKTQLTGAETIFHAILFVSRKRVRGVWRVIAREPNHGSAARPERPDWDTVRSSYAHRAFNQYGYTGRALFAWLPTRTFKPKGY